MSDSDLVKLYSGRILALAADIPHLGRLPAPEGSAKRSGWLYAMYVAAAAATMTTPAAIASSIAA